MKRLLFVIPNDRFLVNCSETWSAKLAIRDLANCVTVVNESQYLKAFKKSKPDIVVYDEDSDVDIYAESMPAIDASDTIIISHKGIEHKVALLHKGYRVINKPINQPFLLVWCMYLTTLEDVRM